MNRTKINLAMLVVFVATTSSSVLAIDESQLIDMAAQKTVNTLAQIDCTVSNELGTATYSGLAVCVDSKGLFLTLAIEPRVPVESIKEIILTPSGLDEKPIPAKLVSIDSDTGLVFVQATQEHKWEAVQFAKTASFKAGDPLVSVNLMAGDGTNPRYYGVAYFSTMLRLPNRLAYASSGNLTGTGSPVFNQQGEAVGLVSAQLFLNYQTASSRGPMDLPLRGQQVTTFFTPVDEFAYALDHIGQAKKSSWLGIVDFEPLPETGILNTDKTAVMVGQVAPGFPAAIADIRPRDLIVGFNGKPLEKLGTPELTRQNFARELVRLDVGQKVTLTIQRGREAHDVTLVTEAMPTRPSEAPRYVSIRLGMIARDKVMLDDILAQGRLPKTPGVLAAMVPEKGPADAAGVKNNDLIVSVNDIPVKSVAEFKKEVEAALGKKATSIKLGIQRGQETLSVSVQPAPEQTK
jgi:serine protease Do